MVSEYICSMTKYTFIVKKDPKTGLRYIKKGLDEMTKSHREYDRENIAPIMPGTPDMCNRLSCNII